MNQDSIRRAATEALKSAYGPFGEPSWAHVSGWAQLNGACERKISCVVVCREMSEWLGELLPKLSDLLTEAGFPWEINCVDAARRRDGTAEMLSAWSDVPGFRWIRLGWPIGQAAAVLTGLHSARGDAVLLVNTGAKPSMDLLPSMISKWDQGHEVVLVRRDDDKGAEFLDAWNIGPSVIESPTIGRRISSGIDIAILLDRRVVDMLLAGNA
jgi:hypothetical protein